MGLFDKLTSVSLVSSTPKSAVYSAPLDKIWSNHGGSPLGGLFSALIIRALLDFHNNVTAKKDAKGKAFSFRPVSLTLNYLDAPPLGSTIHIEISLDRVGKTFAFTRWTIVLPQKGTVMITGTAMFSTLAPDQPHVAAEELTLPTRKVVPERKYVGIGGPATFMNVFDCRELGGVGGEEYTNKSVVVGGVERQVMNRGLEKFIQIEDGSPISWPLLALVADLPFLPQSTIRENAALREKGIARIYSTMSHTITFSYLPSGSWLRQIRQNTVATGQLRESEFYFWPLEGGVPCCIGRQVGWMRDIQLKGKM